MNKQVVSIVATGIALASVHSATAQTAPGQPAQSRSAKSQSTSPTKAVSTQYLMQNSGGSLLQASQGQPAAPANETANVAPLSLIGVPETPPHVLKKHDLVNIVVQEASKSESAGTMDLQQKVDFDAKVDAFVKLNLAKLSVQGGAEGANPPEVKLEGQRDFNGQGTYDRSDTVSLRLEAEVIDVKPNGNLVVQARRHIKVDEEEVSVSLTGTCRVTDVDATNSVLSTDLQDLDFQKTTKGAVKERTQRGFLSRLLDFANPF